MSEMSALKERLEAMMRKVEAMERGGDLEALLESETTALKKDVYEAAIQIRQTQAAQKADFPPSGM